MLPESNLETALFVAEKLRKIIEEHEFIFEQKRIPVTFSCGVAECPQRPWVKQPHPPLDLSRARATVAAETAFGRPGRRSAPARAARHGTAGRGLSSFIRRRSPYHACV